MTIKNESKINKWDSFSKRIILKCGCFNSGARYKEVVNLKDFSEVLISDTLKKVLESEIIELTEEKFVLEFHYCPLVAAWLKQTDNQEEIARLCDISMDENKEIVSTLKDYKIDIQSTIASGSDFCHIVIEKKE